MKRLTLLTVFSIAMPALALAQTPVPQAPPPAPAPPAVVAVPAPMAVPTLAPMPVMAAPTPIAVPMPAVPAIAPQVVVPSMVDAAAIADAMRAAAAVQASTWIDAQAIRDAAEQAAQQAQQAAQDAQRLQVMPLLGQNLNDLRWQLMDWQSNSFVTINGSSEASNYSRGQSLQTGRQYDQAIAMFDKVIAAKGQHADGALYNKAWCQAKLGRADDAVATLAELRRDYKQSLYLKDAAALEADVRKLGPSQVDDDDIKLLALQGIMYQNPDTAIPAIEAFINRPTNSLQLRERALYVLATSDQPRAHQVLLSYAKGGGNPDLQLAAIGYLANRGQKTSSADLIDIYNGSSNLDVRLSVIRAFRSAGAKGPLMNIASGRGIGMGSGGAGSTTVVAAGGRGGRAGAAGAADAGRVGAAGGAGGRGAGATSSDPQALARLAQQRLAINGLADLASPQELWPLYQKEENKDLRTEWVSTFSSMGAVDQLMQIVKTEKDPAVRLRAVRSLGNTRSAAAGPALVEMYNSGDKDTRSAVIAALSSQENAESLVAIARKETDPQLTREIVSDLATMAKTSPVAMNYLLELIKK